jgi:hypothetical protein
MAEEQNPWHRLFALSWRDFFHGLPVTVDFEKDMAVQKQQLDLLLIRKESGPLGCRLPDGFEDLATHNLVTFKSHQDKLSDWALKELVGHYVSHRKQVSPAVDEDKLLPEEEFRLYAVSARYPRQLAGRGVRLQPVAEGVYEVQVLTSRIRVIVANQLPQQEHNAMLHLFSSQAELLSYGAGHYRPRSGDASSLLFQLIEMYQEEGLTMPDKLEEWARENLDRLLNKRLAELPVEKRLEGLSAEQRLKGLSVEERLKGLSAEELRELAEKLKGNGDPGKPA